MYLCVGWAVFSWYPIATYIMLWQMRYVVVGLQGFAPGADVCSHCVPGQ